jgi:hypothetical protein
MASRWAKAETCSNSVRFALRLCAWLTDVDPVCLECFGVAQLSLQHGASMWLALPSMLLSLSCHAAPPQSPKPCITTAPHRRVVLSEHMR